MVLEGSQDEHAAAISQMHCGPESLGITHQEAPCKVVSDRSNSSLIVDNLQEQRNTDNNFILGCDSRNKGQYFNGKPFQTQNTFMEKENNNNNSDISHLFKGRSEAEEATECRNGESKASVDTSSKVKMNQHQMNVVRTRNEPNLLLTHPKLEVLCDEELISRKDQDKVNPENTSCSDVNRTDALSLNRNSCTSSPSNFSSSDEDGLYDGSISRDSKCSKMTEQAMKLGYPEESVMQVLAKLGSQCALNDLLSELIKLGISDSALPSSQVGQTFRSEILNLGKPGTEKCSLESGDSLNFSKSGDLQGGSQNSACLGGCGADVSDSDNLCDIVIDGSNVAMSHGKTVFSCKGIQIAVDWFRARGHQNITVFVPQWRKEASHPDTPITDQDILCELEKQRVVVFTPSRRVKGRRVICYDDRYILKLAVETSGIVVSNDVYRDLVNENEEFRKVVDQRLLMFSFVNDRFMPPEDPLGRLGPTLDEFLRKTPAEPIPKPQDCPYGKKCTYGNKCRFYHPKRGYFSQKSITETLKEQAQFQLQERASKMAEIAESGRKTKQKLSRTKSLIPVESLPPVSSGETKNTSSRPKFGHSKSLLYPTKSSDYLNEPRRKLEEAEYAAALEKAEHAAALLKASAQPDASFVQRLLTDVCTPDDFTISSKSKSSGLNLSAVWQKDVFRENTLATDSQFKSPSPLKSLTTNSSQVSTSLLTLPNAESREGYLSGHLYLAKKLSDESSEGNFFSEHTSSTSSTQQQSQLNPSGKITEQKQLSKVDTFTSNPQDDSSRYFETTSQFHNSLLQQNPAYASQTDQYSGLTSIPSLSIFEAGTSWCSQKCDSGILSPTDRYESSDSTKLASYMFRNIDPLSPDSGNFLSNYNSGQYQNQFENHPHFKSYPLSKAEEAFMSQQNQCLHRNYSSIDNVRAAEDTYQKFGKRSSGFAPFHSGDIHSMLKPQYSIPTHLTADPWQSGHTHGLRRQNSNSDPQIHNISAAGNVHNMFPSSFNSEYSVKSSKDTYSSQSQQLQNQLNYFQQPDAHNSYQQNQFENQDSFKRQQYEQESSLLFPHLLMKPLSDSWGQTVNPANLDYISLRGRATQSMFNQYQSQAPIPKASNLSHFLTSTGPQNMTAANVHNYHLQHPAQYSQLPMMQSSQYSPASTSTHQPSTSTHPPPTSHGFSSLSLYPQNNVLPPNKIHSFQPSGKSINLNEDASIQPDNPCYQIYYHLSNVFGESVVRKVLNRNPGVLNPAQICKLIMNYKEGRGN